MHRSKTKLTKSIVRPGKTQIRLDIRPAWSESSLSAWRSTGSLATHWAHSEDWSDWADAQRLHSTIVFSIDNNVNISSTCSKTVHTKFTKPLILRGHHSPPMWSKNIHFLPNSVRHYLLSSWYTMSSHRIVLSFFTGSTKQNEPNIYPVTGFPTKVCLILTDISSSF